MVQHNLTLTLDLRRVYVVLPLQFVHVAARRHAVMLFTELVAPGAFQVFQVWQSHRKFPSSSSHPGPSVPEKARNVRAAQTNLSSFTHTPLPPLPINALSLDSVCEKLEALMQLSACLVLVVCARAATLGLFHCPINRRLMNPAAKRAPTDIYGERRPWLCPDGSDDLRFTATSR